MRTTAAKLLQCLVLLALVVVGTSCEVGSDEEEDDALVQEERLRDPSLVIENQSEEPGAEGRLAAGYCPGCANCVYRGRCLQPRLPSGLTYWSQKLGIVNSSTPRIGCVAMIYTGSQYGHVAYVSDKHADGTITIREGNWIGDSCSSRRRTPANLNIRGYWCP